MMEAPAHCKLEKIGAWHILTTDKLVHPKYRDPAYCDELRKAIGEQAYRREVERDWTVSAGNTFYIDVTRSPESYKFDPPHLLDAPITVGLDFGRRHPAAVWLQPDVPNDRIFALREWMPSLGVDYFESGAAHSFRDVVLWLSGLAKRESLGTEPNDIISSMEEAAARGDWPSVPFFRHPVGKPIQFIFRSGHESEMTSQMVAAESREKTVHDIWASAGVDLPPHSVPVKSREDAIRRLLIKREDGWPGLLVSRWCPILFEALNGGLVFAKDTAGGPSDNAHKDGYYDNIHDAAGYGIVAIGDHRKAGGVRPGEKGRIVMPSPDAYARPVEEDAEVPYEVRSPVFPMGRSGTGSYFR
jgi:hypothetical protein